jgi:hypothetical protein
MGRRRKGLSPASAASPSVHNPGLNLITSNRDDAQLIFGSVVISGQAAVVDIALQGDPKR